MEGFSRPATCLSSCIARLVHGLRNIGHDGNGLYSGGVVADLNMQLRLAEPSDVSRIVALERAPGARIFIGQWSEERHRATLTGDDARYFVSDSGSGDLAAYAILRGFSEDSRAIELKRIVVAEPGKGFGRRILTDLVRLVFEEYGAHRLFLDVYEDNVRARHLYEELGFQYEGTLREAARRNGAWCNLRLMSLLEEEYKLRRR